MKTNRIPFSLEKYESGKYKVVTRDGRSVRIVCTNCKNVCSIVALIKTENGIEGSYSYYPDGKSWEHTYSDIDLLLEEITFENGDIIKFGYNRIGILKEICNEFSHSDYITLTEESLSYMLRDGWTNHNMRLATEEEKNRLFDALKKDGKRWNAEKKCVEDIKEYQFKPFDKVLVRDSDAYKWDIDLFKGMTMDGKYIGMSHICRQCIPYEGNESLYRTNKNPI